LKSLLKGLRIFSTNFTSWFAEELRYSESFLPSHRCACAETNQNGIGFIFKVSQEIFYENIIYEVFQRNKTSQQNSIVLFELAEDL
jgi:hypothetical protein